MPDVDTAGPTDEKCQTSSTPDFRKIGWVLWGLNLSCVVLLSRQGVKNPFLA